MTTGGAILGDTLAMLAGIALVILGIALIFFWVGGTWMMWWAPLAGGVVCICGGSVVVCYFGR